MKTCKFEGCNGKVHGKGYCHKHWQQLYRSGKVLDRTRYDKANIRIEGAVAYIIIYDKRETPFEEAIIDAEDAQRVEDFKWHIQSKGYIASNEAGLLHRLIIGASKEQIVDHINRDKLDNRKANLRIASRSANVHNSKIHITNTSGAKGVCFHKATGKWEAFIRVNNVRKREYFAAFEDAVTRRAQFEREASLT
jgi:hypothetical protein